MRYKAWCLRGASCPILPFNSLQWGPPWCPLNTQQDRIFGLGRARFFKIVSWRRLHSSIRNENRAFQCRDCCWTAPVPYSTKTYKLHSRTLKSAGQLTLRPHSATYPVNLFQTQWCRGMLLPVDFQYTHNTWWRVQTPRWCHVKKNVESGLIC